MRARLLGSTLLTLLLLAAPAIAQRTDNGEGLVGETDDKVVTFFAFGVLFFFVILCGVLTVIQTRLERRKDERKADRLHQRIGW